MFLSSLFFGFSPSSLFFDGSTIVLDLEGKDEEEGDDEEDGCDEVDVTITKERVEKSNEEDTDSGGEEDVSTGCTRRDGIAHLCSNIIPHGKKSTSKETVDADEDSEEVLVELERNIEGFVLLVSFIAVFTSQFVSVIRVILVNTDLTCWFTETEAEDEEDDEDGVEGGDEEHDSLLLAGEFLRDGRGDHSADGVEDEMEAAESRAELGVFTIAFEEDSDFNTPAPAGTIPGGSEETDKEHVRLDEELEKLDEGFEGFSGTDRSGEHLTGLGVLPLTVGVGTVTISSVDHEGCLFGVLFLLWRKAEGVVDVHEVVLFNTFLLSGGNTGEVLGLSWKIDDRENCDCSAEEKVEENSPTDSLLTGLHSVSFINCRDDIGKN